MFINPVPFDMKYLKTEIFTVTIRLMNMLELW